MKICVYSAFAFLLLFCTWPAFAKVPNFNVSPKVCVVDKQRDFCELDIQVSWQLPSPNDVCLFQDNQQLKCWTQKSKGQLKYKARVQLNTLYSLVNPHTGDAIASSQIAVQSTEAKTTRRRLRSPWSFF